jgi:hypothetical protein
MQQVVSTACCMPHFHNRVNGGCLCEFQPAAAARRGAFTRKLPGILALLIWQQGSASCAALCY